MAKKYYIISKNGDGDASHYDCSSNNQSLIDGLVLILNVYADDLSQSAEENENNTYKYIININQIDYIEQSLLSADSWHIYTAGSIFKGVNGDIAKKIISSSSIIEVVPRLYANKHNILGNYYNPDRISAKLVSKSFNVDFDERYTDKIKLIPTSKKYNKPNKYFQELHDITCKCIFYDVTGSTLALASISNIDHKLSSLRYYYPHLVKKDSDIARLGFILDSYERYNMHLSKVEFTSTTAISWLDKISINEAISKIKVKQSSKSLKL